MKPIAVLMVAAGMLAGAAIWMFPSPGHAAGQDAPVFVTTIPSGYRDWRLVSVAREEGELDDIRAILGNDKAIEAYREGRLPFPEGTIIARIAWSYDASEENNKTFGGAQSFVAGHAKNGVQFMVKDSKKYAATGGWGTLTSTTASLPKRPCSQPASHATWPSRTATTSSPVTHLEEGVSVDTLLDEVDRDAGYMMETSSEIVRERRPKVP